MPQKKEKKKKKEEKEEKRGRVDENETKRGKERGRRSRKYPPPPPNNPVSNQSEGGNKDKVPIGDKRRHGVKYFPGRGSRRLWRADGIGLWVSASRPRPFRASGSPSVPLPPLVPAAARVATGVSGWGGWLAVKILLRIVCRLRPTAPDVTTGKNRKSPGNRRKNSSGSDPLPPPPPPMHGSLLSSLSLSLSLSFPSHAPSFGSTFEIFFLHTGVSFFPPPLFFFDFSQQDFSRNEFLIFFKEVLFDVSIEEGDFLFERRDLPSRVREKILFAKDDRWPGFFSLSSKGEE